jgi:acetyl-CoA carboxylase biotin carboxyl carrier protein
MLGTFYRAPAPGEQPFVEVGQEVKAEDTVCIIEVMKLFNSIKAGVAGRVAEIRAENAALVEYNEILVVIEAEKG